MESKERNLRSLKAELHDTGKAARGLTTILQFINNDKNTELKHLLRFHSPISVFGEELKARFDIDALLEYYNLLLVALFAGYIPSKFDEITSNEIKTILSHPSVIPYYEEHYQYQMVSFTLQFAEEKRQFEQKANSTTISIFNEFISLNRFIKRDNDVEVFLGMLDHVSYSDENIDDVNEILKSVKKINEVFTSKIKTNAQMGAWGFIKYTAFISQLKELLEASKEYPLFQSSLWMFHGYYLDRMNYKMKEVFSNAFINLEKLISDPIIFKNIMEELYGNDTSENINEMQLSDFAKNAIMKSRADVNFVLNSELGITLKEYFNKE